MGNAVQEWNNTKIVATIGPASNDKKMLTKLLLAGADVFRINGAHGTTGEHIQTISLIRNVAEKEGFAAAILFDLPGPKIRIGKLAVEPITLKAESVVTLACGQNTQTKHEIPVPLQMVAKSLKRGSQVFLNDGIIELKVQQIRGSDVECLVVVGGELRSHKGMNLPDAKLKIGGLTSKDKELLETAIKYDVDYIGLSFVRSAKNVLELKKILSKYAPEIGIISKIEKPEALKNIDEIIEVSDGIMVARGDLGIEVPFYKVPAIQKDLLTRCHMAGKPAITATQMLESMVTSGRPTRAEASDVANAVWEGTDALMLSEETSIGEYPELAVKAMSKIALEAEKQMPGLPLSLPPKETADFQSVAISQAAKLLSQTLRAKAIVTPTRSGRTALFVSKQRPNAQIIAPTENPLVARRMSLYWGVRPILMPKVNSVDELLDSAERLALKYGVIKKGDTIVITSGAHAKESNVTSLVEVRQAGI